MGKQLANFITCGSESSAHFLVIYKAGRELVPYWCVFNVFLLYLTKYFVFFAKIRS
jgi:hypothetical protein